MPDTIGFIGLGLMGQGMTKCLTQAGFKVIGFDIDPIKIKVATEHGVVPVSNAQAVAEASDIILICVMTPSDLESAIFKKNGVAFGIRHSAVVVDHSTTPVDITKLFAARLKKAADAGWIDAPVSGGPKKAAAGELAIMAGGEKVDITKVHNVMETLASSFTLFGNVGAGQVAKMVNQVLVLNNYAIIAEAMALAEAGGINASKIPEALATGHAGSNLLSPLFRQMLDRDFRPRGRARQILKDLDTLSELARTLETPTPMSSQATRLFRKLVARGDGELDGAAVLKLYENKSSS